MFVTKKCTGTRACAWGNKYSQQKMHARSLTLSLLTLVTAWHKNSTFFLALIHLSIPMHVSQYWIISLTFCWKRRILKLFIVIGCHWSRQKTWSRTRCVPAVAAWQPPATGGSVATRRGHLEKRQQQRSRWSLKTSTFPAANCLCGDSASCCFCFLLVRRILPWAIFRHLSWGLVLL